MAEERPYPANYAMGLLFVMSLHMLFNGATAILFPEAFHTGYFGGEAFQILYVGIGVTEFVMFLLLLAKSGIAYRLTLILLAAIVLMDVYYLFNTDKALFDLGLQGILGVIAFALLILPKVREYYRNWSIVDIPVIKN